MAKTAVNPQEKRDSADEQTTTGDTAKTVKQETCEKIKEQSLIRELKRAERVKVDKQSNKKTDQKRKNAKKNKVTDRIGQSPGCQFFISAIFVQLKYSGRQPEPDKNRRGI